MSHHIALVLPDLGAGGTERLTLDLASGFLERGAAVDLVVLAKRGELLPLVPDRVRVIDLKAERLREAFGPLRTYFQISRPTAALAAMWPLTTIALAAAAGLRPRPRVVVSEHCPLTRQYALPRSANLLMRASIFASYRAADGIVAVSSGLAGETARLAGVSAARVRAIYNPIPVPARSPVSTADWGSSSGKKILYVGMLKPGKNLPLLLRAFAPLGQAGEAILALVGEGPERQELAQLADELGIAHQVIIPGFTATPGDWYATADLLVLASEYEGFGNVLVEALHYGLPVVSTDCPYGPAEILGAGKWGSLVRVGDAAALTAALRSQLGKATDPAAQRARAADFSASRAVDAYWDLLTGR